MVFPVHACRWSCVWCVCVWRFWRNQVSSFIEFLYSAFVWLFVYKMSYFVNYSHYILAVLLNLFLFCCISYKLKVKFKCLIWFRLNIFVSGFCLFFNNRTGHRPNRWQVEFGLLANIFLFELIVITFIFEIDLLL